jgi:hypothetical protein
MRLSADVKTAARGKVDVHNSPTRVDRCSLNLRRQKSESIELTRDPTTTVSMTMEDDEKSEQIE